SLSTRGSMIEGPSRLPASAHWFEAGFHPLVSAGTATTSLPPVVGVSSGSSWELTSLSFGDASLPALLTPQLTSVSPMVPMTAVVVRVARHRPRDRLR